MPDRLHQLNLMREAFQQQVLRLRPLSIMVTHALLHLSHFLNLNKMFANTLSRCRTGLDHSDRGRESSCNCQKLFPALTEVLFSERTYKNVHACIFASYACTLIVGLFASRTLNSYRDLLFSPHSIAVYCELANCNYLIH